MYFQEVMLEKEKEATLFLSATSSLPSMSTGEESKIDLIY